MISTVESPSPDRVIADSPNSSATASSFQAHIRTAARLLVRLELLWLLLLAPLLLFPTPATTPALLVMPALWLARRYADGHFIPRTPLDWPILAVLLGTLVSLFATPDLRLSLGKVSGVLLGVAVYYAMVAWAATQERVRLTLWAYLAAGLLLTLVTLVGTAWPPLKVGLLGEASAMLPQLLRGLPGSERGFHPNEVGGVLLLIVPLALVLCAWGWRAPPLRRHPLLIASLTLAALLPSLALLLTQSRSAASGLIVAAVLLSWLAFPRLRPLLFAVAALLVAAVIIMGPQELAARLLEAPSPDFTTTNDLLTLKGRAQIWAAAWSALADHPLTGVGMNIFRYLVPAQYSVPFPAPDGDFAHAHNQFLQAWLDIGLTGLLGYVAMWVVAATAVWRLLRSKVSGWIRAAGLGIALSLLAYFVYGLFDTVALGAKAGIFFWALLALLMALQHTTTAAQTQPDAA